MSRRRAIGLASLILVSGVSWAGTAGTARAADATSDSTFTTCFSKTKKGAALFLVDTSRSLKRTDPKNERVKAIQATLSALGSLTTSGKATLYVDFLAFGTQTVRAFPERPEWAEAPQSAADQQSLAARFASMSNADDTDYVGALEPWMDRSLKPDDEFGAIEMLERAPEGACRKLIWITDGQFDLDYFGRPRTVHWLPGGARITSKASADALEPIGRTRLCEPGGLADVLRHGTDITTGASADLDVTALSSKRSGDFGLVRSVATGGDGCGVEPARGSFREAKTAGDLAIVLHEASGQGATLGGTRSCVIGKSTCDDTRSFRNDDQPFAIADTFRGFNLLALKGAASVKPSVLLPDGTEYPLDKGGLFRTPGGVTLKVQEVPGPGNTVVLVDGSLPEDGSAAGTWRLRFRAPNTGDAMAINRSSIVLFGDVTAQLANAKLPLRRGRTGSITVELANARGEPTTSIDNASESELVVAVNGRPLPAARPTREGVFTVPYKVPAGFDGDSVQVSARLTPIYRLAPGAPSVRLATWKGELGTLEVRDLPKSPIVHAARGFDRKFDQQHEQIRSSILVDASGFDSAGCVTLTKSLDLQGTGRVAARARVSVFERGKLIAPGRNCAIRLKAGERRTLEVRAQVDEHDATLSHQRLSGMLEFTSTSSMDPTRSEKFPIDLAAAVDPLMINSTSSVAWILVLAAAALPLLLMYAFNFFGGRIDVGSVRAATIPVRLIDGVIRRTGQYGEEPLTLRGRDIADTPIADQGQHRSVQFGSTTVRTKLPKSPLDGMNAVAIADGAVVVGNLGSRNKHRIGKVDLSMAHNWVFVAPELPTAKEGGYEPFDGVLTVAVPPDVAAGASQLERQAEKIAALVHSVALETARPAGEAADEATTAPHMEVEQASPGTLTDSGRTRPRVETNPFLSDSASGDGNSESSVARPEKRRRWGFRSRSGEPTVADSVFQDPTPKSENPFLD